MLPLIPLQATLAIDLGMTQVVEGETYALLQNGMLRVNNLSLGPHDTLYLHSHDRRNYTVERYTAAQRQAQGLAIDRLPLADHHPLQPPPWPASTPLLVLTEKDAVKCHGLSDTPVWVLPVEAHLDPDLAGRVSDRLAELKHGPPTT